MPPTCELEPGPRRLGEGASRVDPVDCAVVVVTYNSASDVEAVLESVPAATEGLSLRVVVVDNGSTDGTVALLRKRGDVLLVEAGANLGYAGGLNLGRRHAGRFRALLVLNPDVVLEPRSVTRLARVLADDARLGIAVPAILGPDGERKPSLRREPTLGRALGEAVLGDHWPRRPAALSEIVRHDEAYRARDDVEWATGAVALVSATCDRLVGPWDERFFLYSEETDYARRVRAEGFRIAYVPTARARHRAGGSGSSAALVALLELNRVRYMRKRDGSARAFGLVVVLHALLRFRRSGHRLALKALVSPTTRRALPGGHGAPETGPCARRG